MLTLAATASDATFFSLGQGFWDIVLSVCLLASVAMLVVAMFSHPGKISLSPQREAALATGHSDRTTMFESTLLRPLMLVMLSLAHRLALPGLKRWIRGKLVASGNPEFYTPEEQIAVALLTGSALAGVMEVLYLIAAGQFSVVILFFAMGAGMILTILQLYSRASSRVRTIGKRVPYALDLIALAMGAGATFTEAVQTVVKEGGSDPFNAELRAVLAEINLGTTRRRSLENLAERVPLEMLRSIIASIVQAEELGTPLADALHSQATLMRMHRSVRAEHAAAVASVRILLPSLLILMGVVLALFGPMIVNTVENGLFTQ
ncbi:MAG: type II secretion system F family protein [Planctomycetota bacterium]|nr:type II secretion system F family protein [Planctomycetota bacterium]